MKISAEPIIKLAKNEALSRLNIFGWINHPECLEVVRIVQDAWGCFEVTLEYRGEKKKVYVYYIPPT